MPFSRHPAPLSLARTPFCPPEAKAAKSAEARLEIGRQIYAGELTKFEATKKYGIGEDRARDYMRLYRNEHGLPPKNKIRVIVENTFEDLSFRDIEEYEKMSHSELIRELIKVRIREERLKKGYMVEGVGAGKKITAFGRKSAK